MSVLETEKTAKTAVKTGITLGTCLAMVISYTTLALRGLGHLPRPFQLRLCNLFCFALLSVQRRKEFEPYGKI